MSVLERAIQDSEQSSSEQQPSGAKSVYSNDGGAAGKALLKNVSGFSVDFGPGRKDILNFTNQLSVMVKAGISLPDALESIAAQMEKPKFKTIIVDLKNRIESGQSFSQALSEHSDVFSNLFINMVAAAEVSGSLSSMLEQLAGYLDQESETRSQVVGAMVYPIIIAVMAISVTLFLLVFVLPRFLEVFAGNEHLLPTPTRIIMATCGFVRG